MSRPLIAIPARFSASAAALRHAAEVSARRLIEAVYAAGGEPLSVHPSAPDGSVTEAQAGERLSFADGVLLPAAVTSARRTTAGPSTSRSTTRTPSRTPSTSRWPAGA